MYRFMFMLCITATAASSVMAQRNLKRVSLSGLGNPHPGYVSRAYDVSADGTVVVGTNELDPFTQALIIEQGFTWSPSDGQTSLGFLDGIPPSSAALGVSADGWNVVGRSLSSHFGQQAAVWNGRVDPTGLGYLNPDANGFSESQAMAASSDGSVIVGNNRFYGEVPGPPQNRAVRWGRDGIVQDLGGLIPDGDSFANDVSNDGRIVVGRTMSLGDISQPLVREGFSHEAFVWTDSKGMTGLGHLPYDPADVPDAYLETNAAAISSNGKFVVGSSALIPFNGQPDLFHRAFLWTEDRGLEDLGDLPAFVCCLEYDAVDVTTDGETVIGNATFVSSQPTVSEPFVWTRQEGMRTLSAYLRNEFGVRDLRGWNLGEVAAISDDGTTIVGTGINPDGIQEAYQLRLLPKTRAVSIEHAQAIPEPNGVWLLSVGFLLLFHRPR